MPTEEEWNDPEYMSSLTPAEQPKTDFEKLVEFSKNQDLDYIRQKEEENSPENKQKAYEEAALAQARGDYDYLNSGGIVGGIMSLLRTGVKSTATAVPAIMDFSGAFVSGVGNVHGDSNREEAYKKISGLNPDLSVEDIQSITDMRSGLSTERMYAAIESPVMDENGKVDIAKTLDKYRAVDADEKRKKKEAEVLLKPYEDTSGIEAIKKNIESYEADYPEDGTKKRDALNAIADLGAGKYDNLLTSMGQEMQKTAQDFRGPIEDIGKDWAKNKEFDESLVGKVMHAGMQMLPSVAIGALTRNPSVLLATRAPKVAETLTFSQKALNVLSEVAIPFNTGKNVAGIMPAAKAALPWMINFGQEYEDARAELVRKGEIKGAGFSEKAGLYGYTSGSLDTFVEGATLAGKLMPKGAQGLAGNLLRRSIGGASGFLVEGSTEGAQKMLQNVIVDWGKPQTFETITEGAGEEALIGGILGGGLATITTPKAIPNLPPDTAAALDKITGGEANIAKPTDIQNQKYQIDFSKADKAAPGTIPITKKMNIERDIDDIQAGWLNNADVQINGRSIEFVNEDGTSYDRNKLGDPSLIEDKDISDLNKTRAIYKDNGEQVMLHDTFAEVKFTPAQERTSLDEVKAATDSILNDKDENDTTKDIALTQLYEQLKARAVIDPRYLPHFEHVRNVVGERIIKGMETTHAMEEGQTPFYKIPKFETKQEGSEVEKAKLQTYIANKVEEGAKVDIGGNEHISGIETDESGVETIYTDKGSSYKWADIYGRNETGSIRISDSFRKKTDGNINTYEHNDTTKDIVRKSIGKGKFAAVTVLDGKSKIVKSVVGITKNGEYVTNKGEVIQPHKVSEISVEEPKGKLSKPTPGKKGTQKANKKLKTLDEIGAFNNLGNAIRNIAKRKDHVGATARMLLGGKLPSDMAARVTYGTLPFKSAGAYNSDTNEILLDLDNEDDYLNQDGSHDIEATLVHEILHAATQNKLLNSKQLSKHGKQLVSDIEAAMAEFMKVTESSQDENIKRLRDRFMKSNLDVGEFLSELGTNVHLQRHLQTQHAVKATDGGQTYTRNWFQRIMDSILSFIRGVDTNPHSQLAKSFRDMNDLVKLETKATEIKAKKATQYSRGSEQVDDGVEASDEYDATETTDPTDAYGDSDDERDYEGSGDVGDELASMGRTQLSGVKDRASQINELLTLVGVNMTEAGRKKIASTKKLRLTIAEQINSVTNKAIREMADAGISEGKLFDTISKLLNPETNLQMRKYSSKAYELKALTEAKRVIRERALKEKQLRTQEDENKLGEGEGLLGLDKWYKGKTKSDARIVADAMLELEAVKAEEKSTPEEKKALAAEAGLIEKQKVERKELSPKQSQELIRIVRSWMMDVDDVKNELGEHSIRIQQAMAAEGVDATTRGVTLPSLLEEEFKSDDYRSLSIEAADAIGYKLPELGTDEFEALSEEVGKFLGYPNRWTSADLREYIVNPLLDAEQDIKPAVVAIFRLTNPGEMSYAKALVEGGLHMKKFKAWINKLYSTAFKIDKHRIDKDTDNRVILNLYKEQLKNKSHDQIIDALLKQVGEGKLSTLNKQAFVKAHNIFVIEDDKARQETIDLESYKFRLANNNRIINTSVARRIKELESTKDRLMVELENAPEHKKESIGDELIKVTQNIDFLKNPYSISGLAKTYGVTMIDTEELKAAMKRDAANKDKNRTEEMIVRNAVNKELSKYDALNFGGLRYIEKYKSRLEQTQARILSADTPDGMMAAIDVEFGMSQIDLTKNASDNWWKSVLAGIDTDTAEQATRYREYLRESIAKYMTSKDVVSNDPETLAVVTDRQAAERQMLDDLEQYAHVVRYLIESRGKNPAVVEPDENVVANRIPDKTETYLGIVERVSKAIDTATSVEELGITDSDINEALATEYASNTAIGIANGRKNTYITDLTKEVSVAELMSQHRKALGDLRRMGMVSYGKGFAYDILAARLFSGKKSNGNRSTLVRSMLAIAALEKHAYGRSAKVEGAEEAKAELNELAKFKKLSEIYIRDLGTVVTNSGFRVDSTVEALKGDKLVAAVHADYMDACATAIEYAKSMDLTSKASLKFAKAIKERILESEKAVYELLADKYGRTKAMAAKRVASKVSKAVTSKRQLLEGHSGYTEGQFDPTNPPGELQKNKIDEEEVRVFSEDRDRTLLIGSFWDVLGDTLGRYGIADEIIDIPTETVSGEGSVKSKEVKNEKTYDGEGIRIGRPSVFGNPFTHKAGTKADIILPTRNDAVLAYAEWIATGKYEGLDRSPSDIYDKINNGELDNDSPLVCHCAPKACHGHVLEEVRTPEKLQEAINDPVGFVNKIKEKISGGKGQKPRKLKHKELVTERRTRVMELLREAERIAESKLNFLATLDKIRSGGNPPSVELGKLRMAVREYQLTGDLGAFEGTVAEFDDRAKSALLDNPNALYATSDKVKTVGERVNELTDQKLIKELSDFEKVVTETKAKLNDKIAALEKELEAFPKEDLESFESRAYESDYEGLIRDTTNAINELDKQPGKLLGDDRLEYEKLKSDLARYTSEYSKVSKSLSFHRSQYKSGSGKRPNVAGTRKSEYDGIKSDITRHKQSITNADRSLAEFKETLIDLQNSRRDTKSESLFERTYDAAYTEAKKVANIKKAPNGRILMVDATFGSGDPQYYNITSELSRAASLFKELDGRTEVKLTTKQIGRLETYYRNKIASPNRVSSVKADETNRYAMFQKHFTKENGIAYGYGGVYKVSPVSSSNIVDRLIGKTPKQIVAELTEFYGEALPTRPHWVKEGSGKNGDRFYTFVEGHADMDDDVVAPHIVEQLVDQMDQGNFVVAEQTGTYTEMDDSDNLELSKDTENYFSAVGISEKEYGAETENRNDLFNPYARGDAFAPQHTQSNKWSYSRGTAREVRDTIHAMATNPQAASFLRSLWDGFKTFVLGSKRVAGILGVIEGNIENKANIERIISEASTKVSKIMAEARKVGNFDELARRVNEYLGAFYMDLDEGEQELANNIYLGIVKVAGVPRGDIGAANAYVTSKKYAEYERRQAEAKAWIQENHKELAAALDDIATRMAAVAGKKSLGPFDVGSFKVMLAMDGIFTALRPSLALPSVTKEIGDYKAQSLGAIGHAIKHKYLDKFLIDNKDKVEAAKRALVNLETTFQIRRYMAKNNLNATPENLVAIKSVVSQDIDGDALFSKLIANLRNTEDKSVWGGVLSESMDYSVLPTEIRELFGKTPDGGAFVLSVMKDMMERSVKADLLDKLEYLGKIIRPDSGIVVPDGWVRIPSAFGIDAYASKDVVSALEETLMFTKQGAIGKTVSKWSGFANLMATAFNPMGGIRNFLGGVSFGAGSGLLLDGKNMKDATLRSYRYFRETTSGKDETSKQKLSGVLGEVYGNEKEYGDRLHDLGVRDVDVSLIARAEQLTDVGDSKTDEADIMDAILGTSPQGVSALRAKSKRVRDFLTQFYQAPDNMWKDALFAHRLELELSDRNVRDINGKIDKYKLMEAEKRAAEFVKSRMPTFTRISGITQFLKNARMAPFAAFLDLATQISVLNPYNDIAIISGKHSMMKGATPYMQGIYRKEAYRSLIMHTAMMAMPVGIMALTRMLGVDDEEEEAYRALLPPFEQNSQHLLMFKYDGKICHINFDFMNFTSVVTQPLLAALSDAKRANRVGESAIKDGLGSLVKEAFAPILTPNLAIGSLVEAYTNRLESGGEVVNPASSVAGQLTAKTWHVAQTIFVPTALRPFMPGRGFWSGAVTGVDNRGNKLEEGQTLSTVLGVFTPVKVRSINYEKAATAKIYQAKREMEDADRLFKSTILSNPDKDTTKSIAKHIDGIYKRNTAELAFGLRLLEKAPKEVKTMLSTAGITGKVSEAIISGQATGFHPSKTTVKKLNEKTNVDIFSFLDKPSENTDLW